MGKIIIIGLGPGDYENLTLKTLNILKSAKCLVLRTKKHPLVKDLMKLKIDFQSCDDIYDNSNDFEEVYEEISDRIINLAKEKDEVVYGVPGHPFVAEKSVQLIIEKSKNIIDLKIESAMSFIDIVSAALKIDIASGLKIIDGLRLGEQRPDTDSGNIITQVYSRLVASEIKLKLMDYYRDDQRICVIRIAYGVEKSKWIMLYELDKIDWLDYLTSIYIPPIKENKKYNTINDLISLMEELRGENGCSWDRKQDHKSLKPYLLEECYEVMEAIDKEDIDSMIEELGDILLQVVFHAQLGKERGEFDINDIITGLVNKLINRHPHVFGDTITSTEAGAERSWESAKRKEKKTHRHVETLIDVPIAMSSLIRSYKIQQKAALVGFDWDDVEGAMDKVDEELAELKEVYKSSNNVKIEEEMGDLLFAVVNVARFLKIQPELALKATIEKFINRFKIMEELALSLGKNLAIMSLYEMDSLWNKAKTHNFTKNDKN